MVLLTLSVSEVESARTVKGGTLERATARLTEEKPTVIMVIRDDLLQLFSFFCQDRGFVAASCFSIPRSSFERRSDDAPKEAKKTSKSTNGEKIGWKSRKRRNQYYWSEF